MTSQRIRVGVVGAGFAHSPDGRERWAVRTHLPALKHLSDDFEVTAVCTTRMSTADETARHFDVPNAFDDVEKMVELPELDAVCVSVRPDRHYEVVMAAMRAKKHIYCEHPLGTTTAQASEMHSLARQKDLRTIVGHQSHHLPAPRYLADLIAEGFIGRPLSFGHSYFASNYISPRPSHRQWLFDSTSGGHPGYRSGFCLDRVTTALGSPVEQICADMSIKVPERAALDRAEPIRSDQVDNMNYLLRLRNGATGTMQVCWTAWMGTEERLEVYGEEGMLYLAADKVRESPKHGEHGDPHSGLLKLYGARVDVGRIVEQQIPPEMINSTMELLEIPAKYRRVWGIEEERYTFGVAQAWLALADAIRDGTETHPSFFDVLQIHQTLDAAEVSQRTAAWAQTPPLEDAAASADAGVA